MESSSSLTSDQGESSLVFGGGGDGGRGGGFSGFGMSEFKFSGVGSNSTASSVPTFGASDSPSAATDNTKTAPNSVAVPTLFFANDNSVPTTGAYGSSGGGGNSGPLFGGGPNYKPKQPQTMEMDYQHHNHHDDDDDDDDGRPTRAAGRSKRIRVVDSRDRSEVIPQQEDYSAVTNEVRLPPSPNNPVAIEVEPMHSMIMQVPIQQQPPHQQHQQERPPRRTTKLLENDNDLSQMNNRIQLLLQKSDALKKRLNKSNHSPSVFDKILSSKRSSNNNNNAHSDEEYQRLEEKYQDLMDEREEEKLAVKEELRRLHDTIDTLQSQVDTYETEKKQTEEQSDAITAKDEAYRLLEEKYQELVAERKEETILVKEEITRLHNTIDILQTQLKQAQNQEGLASNDTNSESYRRLEENYQDLLDEREEEKIAVKSEMRRLYETIDSFQSQVETYEEERDDMFQTCRNLSRLNDEKDDKIKELDEQLQRAQTQQALDAKEIETLKEQLEINAESKQTTEGLDVKAPITLQTPNVDANQDDSLLNTHTIAPTSSGGTDDDSINTMRSTDGDGLDSMNDNEDNTDMELTDTQGREVNIIEEENSGLPASTSALTGSSQRNAVIASDDALAEDGKDLISSKNSTSASQSDDDSIMTMRSTEADGLDAMNDDENDTEMKTTHMERRKVNVIEEEENSGLPASPTTLTSSQRAGSQRDLIMRDISSNGDDVSLQAAFSTSIRSDSVSVSKSSRNVESISSMPEVSFSVGPDLKFNAWGVYSFQQIAQDDKAIEQIADAFQRAGTSDPDEKRTSWMPSFLSSD